MLLHTYIARKDTLFLREQLFCVVQDNLLMLIHADIDHKDALFVHEQLLCVVRD